MISLLGSTGESKLFCSNLRPVIYCREQGEVELRVFDEAFQQQGRGARRRSGRRLALSQDINAGLGARKDG